jgi:hypothetical protein
LTRVRLINWGIEDMKWWVLLLLFFSVDTFGQGGDSTRINASNAVIRDLPTIKSRLKFLTVVDGKTHYGHTIKKIDVKSIFYVKVLKENEAIKKYGTLGRNGAVIIDTKIYAINRYQNKLVGFSKEYKTYLEQSQGNESGLT